jgi:Domain of unknown function (DUF4270)
MAIKFLYSGGCTVALALCTLLFSCTKAPITFGSDGGTDPALSYIDDYKVELATLQPDSFLTTGHNVFAVGYHTDPVFGVIQAGAFLQIDLPASNPLKDQNVSYDSLALVLKSNGEYYGDTTLPFHFRVHQLTQKMENDDPGDAAFYNLRRFAYAPVLLGQKQVVISPKRADSIAIRLSDALGADLLNKFKTNAVAIREQDDFVDYFNGIYIGTDTTLCKNLYYFTEHLNKAVVRLYYRFNGVTTQQRYFDFSVNPTHHSNFVSGRYTGTPLAVFTPFKRELKSSTLMGNRAYLHSNANTLVKISFPQLVQIKELHPYVRVVKAILEIRPAPGTYNYPYRLPPILNLHGTDDDNRLNYIIRNADGTDAQTGNLVQDNLYGDNTYYSFDITAFVNSQIQEGSFSKAALMLAPVNSTGDNTLQRLVINNQSIAKSIQLKLYVLGL